MVTWLVRSGSTSSARAQNSSSSSGCVSSCSSFLSVKVGYSGTRCSRAHFIRPAEIVQTALTRRDPRGVDILRAADLTSALGHADSPSAISMNDPTDFPSTATPASCANGSPNRLRAAPLSAKS